MQYIDIYTWLIGDILAKADKMTMAHSLELRVPFLDRKVADLARTLPDNFKWHSGETKYLLREAFRDIIPESTRKRKKLGFPTPVRNWLTKDKKEIFDRIINNEYMKSHLDIPIIQSLIDNHLNKKTDNARKIYLLLMLALWYDVFIKEKTT
jgi:asparagine synthase (glutamine-hydrolysing)